MIQPFCPACLEPLTGLSVCPQCGWYSGIKVDPLYLPPGTVVSLPYQVARVLGHGGFGITYLGWDANLQIKVAIKEYLPRDLARRDPRSGQVLPHSEQSALLFQAGLTRFLDEARTVAKFQQHPGIVSVLAFFPAFGSGYMVMEYVEGQTLKGYLDRHGRLGWTQTLDIFMQIMDALRAVHKAGLLHGDIAPDNIYLCSDGRIKLLDFGAAQASSSELDASSKTVLVKPGFAPEELYHAEGRQGPWSDVYSLAASMYFTLTGQAPPDALTRLKHDRLRPPADYAVMMPPQAEQVLLAALAVSPLQRPQSMETLQNQFLELQIKPVAAQALPNIPVEASPIPLPAGQSAGLQGLRGWLVGGVCVLLILLLFALIGGERQPSVPGEAIQPDEPAQAGSASQDNDAEWLWQREQERQAAEELRQQQAAALKRFEERRLQEAMPVTKANPQTDSRQLEHMRSLCAEWGATMECQELRKNQ